MSDPSSPTSAATSASSSGELKNLELTLSGRELTELPVDLIAQHAPHIVKLDLSDNKLRSLANLPPLPRLHTLLLDKNKLTTLATLLPQHTTTTTPLFPSLTTLWLNNNQLTSTPHTLATLTTLAPSLTYLSMLRNPCVPDMYGREDEAEAYQRHRWFVIYRLRRLQLLDASTVTSAERAEAEVKGEFCVVARPSGEEESGEGSGGGVRVEGVQQALIGVGAGGAGPVKAATFLAKGKPRYDGANSEGNRFIVNEDL